MEAKQQTQEMVFGCTLPKRESEALYNRLQAREKQLVSNIILRKQIELEMMLLHKLENRNSTMVFEFYARKVSSLQGLMDIHNAEEM
jgi:hypothetical protein